MDTSRGSRLSVRGVAEYLGVSVKSVRRMIDEGEIDESAIERDIARHLWIDRREAERVRNERLRLLANY